VGAVLLIIRSIRRLNLDNVGIAVVDGEISIDELKQNFSEIWKTN
jgi:hypothetical protein